MSDEERNNYKTISDSDRVLRIKILTVAEGKGLQNCGQTSFVEWCSDLGNNKRTRSMTRSKGVEDAEVDVRSDKEG